MPRRSKTKQRLLFRWGGRRRGSGRKPKGAQAGVPHRIRPALAARFPVHVTMVVERGLPSLRGRLTFRVVRGALADGCEKPGFRVVEYSVQFNHIHLIAEGSCRERLARGMQGLGVRIAKRLNRFWQRRGRVFRDRYHDCILRTPTEVRRALVYVLQNARRHGVLLSRGAVDPCSSARWFGGWREWVASRGSPLPSARTWLLGLGWRCRGLLSISEVPRAG
ncbi:MAG: transposase [Planctomycetota bacterium]